MDITKTNGGYLIKREGVPNIFLSDQDAFEIMEIVRRKYHLEDVKEKLKNNENIDETKVTDEEIDDICDEYEDRLGDDDSWNFILDSIIKDRLKG